MNIEINATRNEGDLEKERVVFKVGLPDDIGTYLVCQGKTTEDNTSISNSIRRVFWFPDAGVTTGDLVILYTKNGVNKKKKNSNGLTSHFFYWSLAAPIWNEKNSAVVLMKVDEFESQILATPGDIEEVDSPG
ncbi:MAG: hypothetical protein M3R69_11295 [Acidobacteriota bacterium]|nr:hypothetical protein [Acidobacteriota bacterium]